MAENADTAFPSPSRAAAGAQSAPRPAQSGEPSRDENTFDLFHDDDASAHALVLAQAGERGGRQGTLSGFGAAATHGPDAGAEVVAEVEPESQPQPKAAAEAETKAETKAAAQAVSGTATREPTAVSRRAGRAKGAPPAAVDAARRGPAKVAPAQADAATRIELAAAVAETVAAVEPEVEVPRAAAAAGSTDASPRNSPVASDHARAAARPEAVEALYGVIAEQRRAAADLSRRMKWMLGAMVGALLVTVAAGVAQTVVLSRLASDASAQQQRLAQAMQDQQTALAGVLARLDAQTVAPALQAAPESAVRPASPAHRPQHAATHSHHAHSATR